MKRPPGPLPPPSNFFPPKDKILLADFSSYEVFFLLDEIFLFWGRLPGDLKVFLSCEPSKGLVTIFLPAGMLEGIFSAKDFGVGCFFLIPPKPSL